MIPSVHTFTLKNGLLAMAETCSMIAKDSEQQPDTPEVMCMEKEKWNKLKDMCGSLRDGLELFQLRYGGNPDFVTLHQRASEITTFINVCNDKNGTPSKTTKQTTPAPLQRPHFSFKKKKTEESNSESNSDEETKKTKSRRQRAKAAPSEELYCRSCGETQTCEWRRGPDGYKSLCNACGIHYAKIVKKEENALHSYKPKNLKLDMLLNNSSSAQSNENAPPPTTISFPPQSAMSPIAPNWKQITSY